MLFLILSAVDCSKTEKKDLAQQNEEQDISMKTREGIEFGLDVKGSAEAAVKSDGVSHEMPIEIYGVRLKVQYKEA